MIETVRYTYRLRPGAVAERAMLDEWHRCRFLWNEAVHQQRTGRKPTLCTLSRLLTEARGKFAWLRTGSQVAQQQTLRTYATALNHSYKVKGRRKPTVKSHKKAARQNAHASRVWSQRVVANHQVIAVEDFKARFLTRSTMARKAADAAIGAAKRELIKRGTRAGRKVVLVPPAYTTMTCSSCFATAKQQLGLDERNFRCEHCGYTDGRDRNAARTILAMADPGHAGADDVRHLADSLQVVGEAQSELEIPALAAGGVKASRTRR